MSADPDSSNQCDPLPDGAGSPLLPRQRRALSGLMTGCLVFLLALTARDCVGAGRLVVDHAGPTGLDVRIDVNRATPAELLQLPGIGPRGIEELKLFLTWGTEADPSHTGSESGMKRRNGDHEVFKGVSEVD